METWTCILRQSGVAQNWHLNRNLTKKSETLPFERTQEAVHEGRMKEGACVVLVGHTAGAADT